MAMNGYETIERPIVTIALLAADIKGRIIQGVRPKLVSGAVGEPIAATLAVSGYRQLADNQSFPADSGARIKVPFEPLPQVAKVRFLDGDGSELHAPLMLSGVSDGAVPRAEVLGVRRELAAAGYVAINDETFGAQFARDSQELDFTVMFQRREPAARKPSWWALRFHQQNQGGHHHGNVQ
ncbi:hypothetical protein [Lacticaseibacillus nasuensis]|uniref:Uncharacterized protein n=1 Tax=Lacticaseibacillus nasuensis JCM 17158 TaxID=1291734 RepID=A0A0R1JSI1_9LACO|nr:hypothetical protein [Lacticaseibacillus nasuensis]KRK74239.1 hypothetical protein FD02_GL000836 [Lacticaseibacillus nasuensis JCM 17158]